MIIGTETIVCGHADMAHCAPSNIKGLGRATPSVLGREVLGRFRARSRSEDVAFGGDPKPSGGDLAGPALVVRGRLRFGGDRGENRRARYTISTPSRAIPIFFVFPNRRAG